MNGHELYKKLKKYAKKHGYEIRFESEKGKGSHGTLFINGRRTIMKDRTKEIQKGLLRGMLKDLNIDINDL